MPSDPTQADLEVGYIMRGGQVLACDAARRLAVETLAAEHALEDKVIAPPARKRWFSFR